MDISTLLAVPLCQLPKPHCSRKAASLIELLVVLFIMGIMMGLLLPALQGARDRAEAAVCQNHVRQLAFALSRFDNVKRKFPDPGRWTIEVLPWIEQRPLFDQIKYNADPNAKFPRPPLMRCPMQDDSFSRVDSVGFCHYVLVVDRDQNGQMVRGWEIQDRPVVSDGAKEQPWYIGAEIPYSTQAEWFATPAGPHPPDLYMTTGGLRPQ